MAKPEDVVYDPQTIEIMKSALEDAWVTLAPTDKTSVLKSDLASRILKAAANGERDPQRLRDVALQSA